MFLIRLTDTTLDVGNMTKNLKRANVKTEKKAKNIISGTGVIQLLCDYNGYSLFLLSIVCIKDFPSILQ